jgi:predicted amidohydrolase
MSRYLNVAVVQVASPSMAADLDQRKRENWMKLAAYYDQIAMMQPTVDLMVAPELYIDGIDPYNWNALAEPIPGPMTELFCAKARQLGKWLAPGSMLETPEDGETPYNSALLISPDGEIVLKWRKMFIPYPLEPSRPGTSFPIAEIPGWGKVGILICSDAHAPEIARNLMFQGAELILKPTLQASWIGNVRQLTPFTQVRAVENQCFVVCVNHPIPLGMGHSAVADPEGRILEELPSTESWTIFSLDIDEVHRARDVGSMGCFQFVRMLRDFKQRGIPVDEAYLAGLENAPVFRDLPGPAPLMPSQVKRFGEPR